MDKYECLASEDLGYKPGAVDQFGYSLLGKVFNKVLKRDDKVNKVNKYDNDLVYNSVHNFNKCSVSNFNEISSIDCKFDTLEKFYKYFLKLKKTSKVGIKKQIRRK